MKTIITSASVKVMRSFDYCHFETSMVLDNGTIGIATIDVDNARKECMRLCDKAVEQYKVAKEMAVKRTNGKYEMTDFENKCKRISEKSENDRTINEIAMLKRYKDENWQSQFDFNYDYEDEQNQ